MEYVENAMNLAQEILGVNLVMPKDLRKISKIGPVEIKILMNSLQQSQLNAIHYLKCFEWVSFEKFQNITYITKGGFGKIYSAEWPEGHIWWWDIENQEWKRRAIKVALKSLDNSSDISADFLNEVIKNSYWFIFKNYYLYLLKLS